MDEIKEPKEAMEGPAADAVQGSTGESVADAAQGSTGESATDAARGSTGETTTATPQESTGEVKRRHEVFISYSTKNKNVADAIVANFEQHDIRCWYAPRDILPGQEWVSAIKEGLTTAKVFVLIYTDESNMSRQVMNEVALAFNAGKTIVPFRLTEGVMNDELEYYLTRVHWLDAVSKPLERNIEALRQYVEANLHRPVKEDAAQKDQATSPAAQTASKESGEKKEKKSSEKKKSKVGLWIGIAVAALALFAGGVFAVIKLSGPKAEELMEAGKQAFYYGNRGTEDVATARENFEKAAEKGVADAYYYLGYVEEWEYDYEAAKELYEKGSEAGSDFCKLQLGYLYQRGFGVKADFDKAWRLYNEAADNGCAEADYYRGLVVEAGIAGQEFDAQRALEYYKKVVEKSKDPFVLAKAYAQIGEIYRKGSVTVPADYEAALEAYGKITESMDSSVMKYVQETDVALTYKAMGETVKQEEHYYAAYQVLRESAKAGYAWSICQEGICLENGNGVGADYEAAISRFKEANDAVMEKNDNARCYEALYQLGFMAERGYGCGQDYNMAYEHYKEAANAGYGKAATKIGDLYYFGYVGKDSDGKINYELARQWYDRAIECGSVGAYCNIGNIYDKGTDKIEANAEEAASWYLKGAASGSKACMYNLGLQYQKKEDYAKALEWFEKAANMDNTGAYLKLGEYYQKGQGTAQNDAKAAEWYLKAAREGEDKGMLEYGRYLLNGAEGVEKNEEEAIVWLTKAAEKGITTANSYMGDYYYEKEDYDNAFIQYKTMVDANVSNKVLFYRIGRMYLDGSGTEKNESEGIRWLEKSAENDYHNAALALGDYFYNKKDYEQAFRYYSSVVNKVENNKVLYQRIGKMYREGLGTEQDEGMALTWLIKAHEVGARLSVAELKFVAYKYYTGDIVEKDLAKALPYYQEAAEAGDANAMVFLGSIYHYADGLIDYDLALQWYGKALDTGGATEKNEQYCHDHIKALVDDGKVSKEAAAKWLK